jgi:hypothetical protein
MKLTEEQIQELYGFTNRRLVKHYDLQTELVDHLANGIEIQLNEDSQLNFKDALDLEFKRFGHFGFRNVLKQRKKAINKKYNTLILKEYKTFFSLPKILLIILAIAMFFGILRNLPEYKWIISAVLVLPFTIYLWFHALKTQKNYRNSIDKNKKWMLQERIFSLSGIGLMGLNFFHIFIFFNTLNIFSDSILLDGFMSIIIVFSFLLSYIAVFIIPQKAELILSKNYPEYKFVNWKK